MEHYKLTKHAERRANQRGIKHTTIETMLEFGTSKISYGCEVIYMDQAARANLRNRIGRTEYAKIERQLDKILVLSDDGVVVTCCQRTRLVRTRKKLRRAMPASKKFAPPPAIHQHNQGGQNV